MTLYLFRHAEKASPFQSDPKLSEHGMQQASELARRVEDNELLRPDHILVSPRIRAQQSFQALANTCGLSLKLDDDLDEKRSGENRHEFRARLENFLQKIETLEGVVYLCSHYDWLEESLNILQCETDLRHEIDVQWSPLQYISLDLKDGLYHFIESKRVTP